MEISPGPEGAGLVDPAAVDPGRAPGATNRAPKPREPSLPSELASEKLGCMMLAARPDRADPRRTHRPQRRRRRSRGGPRGLIESRMRLHSLPGREARKSGRSRALSGFAAHRGFGDAALNSSAVRNGSCEESDRKLICRPLSSGEGRLRASLVTCMAGENGIFVLQQLSHTPSVSALISYATGRAALSPGDLQFVKVRHGRILPSPDRRGWARC